MGDESDEILIQEALDRNLIRPSQIEECRSILKRLVRPEDRKSFTSFLSDPATPTVQARDDTPILDATEVWSPEEAAAREKEWQATEKAERPPLPEIPGYEILQEVGRGGMGVVYRAMQENPRRQVAIKVLINARFASEETRGRFKREANATANLDHPGVVPVYDVGEHEGYPYYTMEYLEGVHLDKYLATRNFSVADKLHLFVQVCDVVAHAHEHNVVHRDLKPSNIMIDRWERVRVLDFGLAKVLEENGEPAASRTLTLSGMVVGTLAYMSPEQTYGKSIDIDVRSDVYAMGVILYEILTGRLPYTVSDVQPVEALEAIRFEEPSRPSTIIKGLSKDLEAILLQALEKDRELRYASVEALSEDVQRFLHDEPILAKPASIPLRVKKWAKRHKTASAILAAIILATIAILVTISISLVRVRAERDRAVDAESRTRLAKEAEERQRVRAERDAYFANVVLAARKLQAGDAVSARDSLERCPEDLRNWEWFYLKRACRVQRFTLRPEAKDCPGVVSICFSGDGKRAVIGHDTGFARIWDVEKRKEAAEIEMPGQFLALSNAGSLMASASGSDVYVVDLASSRPSIRLGGHSSRVRFLRFVGDDSQLVSVDSRGGVKWWNTKDLREVRNGTLKEDGKPAQVVTADLSADGRRFVYVGPCRYSLTHGASVSDLGSLEFLGRLVGHACPVFSVAVSEDGKSVFTASGDATVRRWSWGTRSQMMTYAGQTSKIRSVAGSADGRFVASVAEDGMVCVWSAEDGRSVLSHPLGEWAGRSLRFVPGQELVAAGMEDGSTEFLATHPTCGRREFAVSGRHSIDTVAFASGGRHVLVRPLQEGAELWEIGEGRSIFRADPATPVASAPKGPWSVASAEGNEIRILGADADAARIRLSGHPAPVVDLVFSDAGNRLASADKDGCVKVWQAPDGREVLGFQGGGGPMAFDPTGRWFAAVVEGNTVHVWDIPASRIISRTDVGKGKPRKLALGGPAPLLAVVADEGKNAIWDLTKSDFRRDVDGDFTNVFFSPWGLLVGFSSAAAGRIVACETGETRYAFAGSLQAFCPDEKRFLTIDSQGNVRLVDLRTGRSILTVPTGARQYLPRFAAFSPDGSRLAAGTGAAVRLWDTATGREVLTLKGHPGPVTAVAFSHDGNQLVSASPGPEGKVIVWNACPEP